MPTVIYHQNSMKIQNFDSSFQYPEDFIETFRGSIKLLHYKNQALPNFGSVKNF